jgi:hypothetical protein
MKNILPPFNNDIPLWIKIPYTLLAAVILPVYWVKYGITNFLWFSDIAFFVMVPALWYKNRFLASMMAIGVLPLESLWLASLCTGGAFLGMANYMYDDAIPLWLRLLSLFHFPMPAAIVYMLYKYGYDRRALLPQIVLAAAVLVLTHLFTLEKENVNIIYPPQGLTEYIARDTYFWAMPLALLCFSILPMHFVLKKWLPPKGDA